MTGIDDDNSDALQAWIDEELDPSQTDAFETGLLEDAPARLTAAEHLALDRGLKSLLSDNSHERAIVDEVRQRIHTGSQPLPAPDSPADEAVGVAHPPILRFISGKRLGQLLSLQQHSMTIGRREAADIVVEEPGISGIHAELSLSDGSLVIRDLGSTNGTRVGGERIDAPRELKSGDAVTIGTTRLLVCNGDLLGDVRLLGIDGPALGTELVISEQPAVIGRKSECQLVLADATASGHHVQIWRDGVQVVIEDLGSNNGTRVNGRSIDSPTALHSGSSIAIGKSRFLYIDGRIDDLAGTSLSCYLLLNRIGAGKAGVVYRARKTGTDAIVAVKCLDPARYSDPAQRARLLNAIRGLKRIDDDHTVPIIDNGDHDGRLYVVTPWYENGSLRDLIHLEETLPVSVIVALIGDAAKALAHADEIHHLRHDGLDDGDILISDDGLGLVADIGLVQAPLMPSGNTALMVTQFFLGEILRRALRQGHDEAGRQLEDLRKRDDIHSSVVDIIERCTVADAGERFADWSALQDALQDALSRCLHRDGKQLAQRAAVTPAASAEPGTLRATRSNSDGADALIPLPLPGDNQARRPSPAPVRNKQERIPAAVSSLIMAAACLLVLLIFIPKIVRSVISSLNTENQTELATESSAKTLSDQRPDRHNTITNLLPSVARRTQSPATPQNDEESTTDAMSEQEAEDSPVADQRARHPDDRDGELWWRPLDDRPDRAVRPQRPSRTAQTPARDDGPSLDTGDTTPSRPIRDEPQPLAAPRTHTAVVRHRVDHQNIDRLLDAARNDTWEQVHVTLTDGREMDAEMRVAGQTLELRHDDEDMRLERSRISDLAYQPFADFYINNGNNELARLRFDRALDLYRTALERHPDHPYLVTKIAMVEGCDTHLHEAIVNNDWPGILAHAETWFRLVKPTSVEREFGQTIVDAFKRQVHSMDENQRERWIAYGTQARLQMTYDPQAPEYLRAAMTSFAADAAPRETMEHFTRALRANAPMDDEHWWAYASTAAALNNRRETIRALDALSPMASKRAEVESLAVTLGLRPPPLRPRLLCLTYIGGPGNQAIQEVGFSANGTPYARGNGFTFHFNTTSSTPTVRGNIHQNLQNDRIQYRPPLTPQSVTVPATGERLTIRYLQVDPILQQPQLESSAGWRFWGWSRPQAEQRQLMADSRGYDIWLYPDGRHVGIMGWTDGGNSVFGRDPQNLDVNIDQFRVFTGSFSNILGGMSTVLMKIDVVERKPVSGTFIANHVFNHAQDSWGRTYIPQQCGRRWARSTLTDPFGLGKVLNSGLFVLDSDLKNNIFHGAIGGRNAQRQSLGLIAVHGNLAILGGFTDATEMKTVNAYQERPGGGLDAMVAVVELWPMRR